MPDDEPTRRAGSQRIRDAERTKAKLRDAALEEFSQYGFAGARVSAIAGRAGVNKQLISYYFGGKEGLYRDLQRSWHDEEVEYNRADVTADDLLRFYLSALLSDERRARMMLWQGLEEDVPDTAEPAEIDREQETFRERQRRGELDGDIDTASLQLALMGMTTAPAAMPHMVRKLFGVEPDSPEFEQRYRRFLLDLLSRLAPKEARKERTEET